MRSRRRKNFKLLLVMLILGLSLGYALISKTLGIVGTSGINSNTWIIHWENVQPNTASTVTAETPVISDHATKVTYAVNLQLPGDFYEFDVDAKNDGTIAGTITEIKHNVHKVVEGEEDDSAPDYIKYSIVYKDTDIPPALGDILGGGDKQTYTIRVEYDKDAEELPDEDIEIKVDTEVTYSQVDTRNKYRIDFDPNGGKVYPTYKYITKGDPIGDMPTATKAGSPFGGWYNPTTDGLRITAGYIPESDMTVVAKWEPAYPTFGTGKTVNAKFKQLAGNDNATYNTNDSNVTAIRRSTTEPTAENTTPEHVVSAEDSTGEIYAWYDNGTIYWWSAGEEEYLNPDSSNMYSNFKNLQTIDTNYNTLLLTNMSGMFAGVTIPSLDISDFNTSSVTNMSATFSGASIENLNVSNIDTSAVKTMNTMFASSNIPTLDLSDFNTISVTDMSTMFASSQATTIDLSSFDTRNVTTLSTMFASSKVTNLDLSHFDVRKVTSFSTLFSGSATTNIDISGWDFASTNSISGLFSGVPNLETINLQNVNTSNITNMGGLFGGSTKIKSLDLSDFDVSNVTTFSLFGGNTALKSVDISGWKFESTQSLSNFFSAGLSGLESVNLKDVDTSNITNMSTMFSYTAIKTLNLESFDTKNVTNMGTMFANMSELKTITVSDDFVVDQVTSDGGMFYNSPNLRGGHNTPQTPEHIDKAYAHYDYGKPDPGYFNRGDKNTFTITLDPNGGSASPLTITVYEGERIGPLPTPERAGYGDLGWYDEIIGGTEITSSFVPNRDMTIHAHWRRIEAKFIDGKAFNVKLKILAGDTIDYRYNSPHTTRDTAITAFQRTPIEPGEEHKTIDNIVSTPDSEKPIYAWFDNGTIYWYTAADNAYTNEDAQYMFGVMAGLTDIDTSFDTSITQNFYYMFYDCNSLVDIDVSTWNTGNAVNMSYMFYTGSDMRTINLSNFRTSKVTDMYSMIGFMNKLEEVDLSNFDFTNYNPGYDFFNKIDSYNSSIKKIKMENVILPQNCYRAFAYESHFIEIDLKNADTSNVTDMHYMFYNDQNLEKVDMTGWDTSNVVDMQNMFGYCNKLAEITGIEDIDTSSVRTMETMFYSCDALEELDLSKWDVSKVTNMYYLLYGNDKLKTLNLSNWDFSSYDTSRKMYNTWYDLDNLETFIIDNAKFPAGSMELAFYGLEAVKNFSLKNVDTTRVTNMAYLFENNEALETLDISSFDTSNVTNMNHMFAWCYNLKTIIVSDKFVMTNPAFQNQSNSADMFTNASKIVGEQGTVWDENYIDKTYAKVDGGENDPGYFTSSSTTNYKVTLNANEGTAIAPETYVVKGQAIGNIPDPTRTGYTFAGWYTSLTDGVKVDPDYIPESDMTIYATWRDAKQYRITFDSNGGTSTQYKRTILKGDPIGELPTAEKENYIFKGWYIEPIGGTKITKDYIPTESIKLYARFTTTPQPESFATDTWETLIAAAKNNTACNAYNVGDEREIDMGTYGKHTIRVANCSKPTVCNNSNFSQTACGFVIEFKDIISEDIVNPYETDATHSIKGNGAIGGWEYSQIRQKINSEIYNSLPEIVKNNIVDTKVISGHSNYEEENYVTNDKLYLLSPSEIYKDNYRDGAKDQTRQLDFYAQRNNSIYSQTDIHSLKNYLGHAHSWWTRQPFDNHEFMEVSDYGGESWRWTSYTSGVSPAFKFN